MDQTIELALSLAYDTCASNELSADAWKLDDLNKSSLLVICITEPPGCDMSECHNLRLVRAPL